MLANVLDLEGLPVAGLEANQFKATYRGKPVQILSARMEPRPRRTIVLLDASGSMVARGGQWELARRMAGEIVSFASAENSVALIAFTKEVVARVDFAQGKEPAMEKLAALREKRKAVAGKKPPIQTAIYDAILEALLLFGNAQPGDAIFVVTDGEDNASRAKASAVKSALLDRNVRLYLCLFDNVPADIRPFMKDPPQVGELLDVSEATGGGFARFRFDYPNGQLRYQFDDQDYATVHKRIGILDRQAREFYLLDIELPEPVHKPRKWKLELVRTDSNPIKDLAVVYPQKLMPCGAQATK